MLLALLLILAGLAGAIAPQTAAAKEFVEIKIGGMATTENFGTYYPVHIPGLRSGWIEYFTTTQHTKRALHLHDVVLEGDIDIEGADLTVVLYGKNDMTGHIRGPKDIRITDGNSQKENSLIVRWGIRSENGDIQIDGNCFVQSRDDIRSEEGYVTIKNATVHVSDGGSIAADDGIKLIGVSVKYAYPGTYWKPLEARIGNEKNQMYRLVNTEKKDLWEVLIGPSSAPSEPPLLEVLMDPESIEFSATEGTRKVEFSTMSYAYPIETGEIKLIKKPDWILCEPDAKFPGRMKLRVPNNYGGERSGEVVFEVKGFTKTCHVTQLAGGAGSQSSKIRLNPSEANVKAEGEEFDVGVQTKDYSHMSLTQYPFTPDAKDWLSITSGDTHSSSDYFRFKIKVEPNTGPERKGTMIFPTSKGTEVLTIHQKAAGDNPEPKPEEPKLTLEPKELKVDADGGKKEVTLSCNVPYNINGLNKPDWLGISGNSPGLEAIQKITITVNDNTGGKREGVITFKTSEGDVTLKVTQAAAGTKPEPKAPKLTLNPEELGVDASAQKKKVTLTSDVPVHINRVSAPGWIAWSEESGETYSKSYTLTISFEANNTGKLRGDVIYFVVAPEGGDEYTVTLPVKQKAAGDKPEPKPKEPTLTLSISFKGDGSAIPAGGGTKEVTVTSNGEWSASLPKDCKWLTLDKDGGTNDGTLTLTAKENTAYEPRKVTLTVSLDEGDKSQTLEITQAAKPKPVLELEQENVVTGPLGSAREVKIRSNVAWKATPTVAWLHVKPSEGTGSKSATLTITADENTAEKGRTGTITIESTDGSKLTRTLTVAQKPAAVAATGISLNPASITMGSGGGMVGFNVYASKGWTISGSPDWMHPDATRGSGTRLVIVRFDRNESGAERTGKLTVKSDDGKAEKVFTLTQRASQRKPSRPSDDGTYDYDLALNPEEITVGPSEGAGSSISVATSRLWAGSTTEDWIRLESAVGRGNGSFTFSLAANPSKEMRHGTITVRTEHGMDELKVAIHQQGRVGDEEAPTRVKVSSVSLDPSSITVNGDLRSKLIGASVYPSNAANKGLLWMSSNPSVATVHVADTRAGLRSGSLRADEAEHTADDYAVVTIVGKGKATIAATASDGSGIVARCEVNVLSTVANTVPYAPQAKVYTVGPTLYLSLPTAETVQVYTLAGTLYRTWQAPAGDTSVTLPLGTYIIKVGHLTEKVVVR